VQTQLCQFVTRPTTTAGTVADAATTNVSCEPRPISIRFSPIISSYRTWMYLLNKNSDGFHLVLVPTPNLHASSQQPPAPASDHQHSVAPLHHEQPIYSRINFTMTKMLLVEQFWSFGFWGFCQRRCVSDSNYSSDLIHISTEVITAVVAIADKAFSQLFHSIMIHHNLFKCCITWAAPNIYYVGAVQAP
jgi:hypothetical protein